MLPLAPLLDSFLPDVHTDEAHLRNHSTHSGAVSFDGVLPNSGEANGGSADELERQREDREAERYQRG
jgi:hypothetical protein